MRWLLGSHSVNFATVPIQVANNKMYVASMDGGIAFYDFSSPPQPVFLGDFAMGYQGNDFHIEGNLIYYADDGAGLQVLDLRDRSNVTRIGRLRTSGSVRSLEAKGSIIYLADGSATLKVVSAEDPTNPRIIHELDLGGRAASIHLIADHLYVIVSNYPEPTTIARFALTNPAKPTRSDLPALGGYVWIAGASDRYLYLKPPEINRIDILDLQSPGGPVVRGSYSEQWEWDRLWTGVQVGDYFYINGRILDVRDSGNPVVAGAYAEPWAYDVSYNGRFVFVWDSRNVKILEVSNPLTPRLVGVTQPLGRYDYPANFVANGSLGVLASIQGIRLFDLSRLANPQCAAQLPSPISDVAFVGTSAYVGSESGLTTLDVSDPSRPVEINSRAAGAVSCLAANDNSLYVGVIDPARFRGIEIFNISGSELQKVGAYHAHGPIAVSVFSDRLYTINNSFGWLEIVDIADKANPRKIGNLVRFGLNNLWISGETAFVKINGVRGDGIEAYDVSNPSQVRLLSEIVSFIEPRISAVAFKENTLYVALAPAYLEPEILAYDVTNPSSPRLISKTPLPGSMPTRSLSITGSHLYTLGLDLTVYDIFSPDDLRLVGRNSVASGHTIFAGPSAVFAAGNERVNVLYPYRPLPTGPLRLDLQSGVHGTSLLKLTGLPGITVNLEKSDDLQHWQRTASHTLNADPIEIPVTTEAPREFFRARQ